MSNINIKAGLIIFFTIIFSTFVFYGYQVMFSPNILLDKEDGYLMIPTGSNFETVKDSLEKNNVLHDRLSFMFLSKLTGYTKKVKPGRYKLFSGDNNWNVIKKLYSGRQEPVKLTFNNIRLKEEFAKRMGDRFEFSSDELLSRMNDNKFLATLKTDTSKVLCLFIPNTYELYWNITADEFLNKMYQYQQKFWTEERKEKARKIGLTEQQVYILASIVEEETKQADEVASVARVYINRLNCGMKLQADPTVRYAVGDFTLRRIYSGHLAVKSPYNTYKYAGLPPGPICLPGIRTIDSTLSSSEHGYLFFCVDVEKPGYHKFTKTFGEHVGVANRYRLNLNKRKIK